MRVVRLPQLNANFLAAGVVAADLLTKRWAAIRFAGGERMAVIGTFLQFEYVENPGAAFSLIRNAGPVLGVIAVLAVIFVERALFKTERLAEALALGAIVGGALGNLMDRIFRGDGFLDGRVIDWIRFPNFPTFNIADSAITVGVATLLILSWSRARTADRPA